MRFRLRRCTLPPDYEPMAAILSAARPLPTTASELARAQSWWPAGTIVHRMLAEDPGGTVIGFAETYRFPNTATGKFYGNTAVHPEARRQGVGSVLLGEVERFVTAHGGDRIVGDVPDTDAASLTFMKQHGYKAERHSYDSLLDLAAFDEAPFDGAVGASEARGIRFFTLADADTRETRNALYALYGRTFPDLPGYEAKSFMTYETWTSLVEGDGARPDWVFIAAEGDRLVGATTLITSREHVYTNHTLVDREYRGRGIALALKLLAVRAALRHGAPYMRTGNDSLNGPMLAVNRKLGYRPLAGDYTVVKRL
jgi:GNAT superfamily N-acetyltransferase